MSIDDKIEALARAVYEEGTNPEYHRRIVYESRAAWPTLWAAIDELLTEWRP